MHASCYSRVRAPCLCADRISVFTAEGAFVRAFASKGSGPGQFMYPMGLTVEGDDVLVAERELGRDVRKASRVVGKEARIVAKEVGKDARAVEREIERDIVAVEREVEKDLAFESRAFKDEVRAIEDKLISFGPRFTFLKRDADAAPVNEDFDKKAMRRAENKLARVEKAVRRDDAAASRAAAQ